MIRAINHEFIWRTLNSDKALCDMFFFSFSRCGQRAAGQSGREETNCSAVYTELQYAIEFLHSRRLFVLLFCGNLFQSNRSVFRTGGITYIGILVSVSWMRISMRSITKGILLAWILKMSFAYWVTLNIQHSKRSVCASLDIVYGDLPINDEWTIHLYWTMSFSDPK